MRIIGGEKKSKKINPPQNLKLRPTTDRLKESILNILMNRFDLEQIRVLDLFSGTGSISYEFCSHGAQEVIAVEIDRKTSKFIERFASQNEFNQLKIVNIDSLKYLKQSRNTQFDVIFADPPYDYEHYQKIPELIFENNHLSDKGSLVIEHDKYTSFSNHPNLDKERKYGDSVLSFFCIKSKI